MSGANPYSSSASTDPWGDPIQIKGVVGKEETYAVGPVARFCSGLGAGRFSWVNGTLCCAGGSLMGVSAATISAVAAQAYAVVAEAGAAVVSTGAVIGSGSGSAAAGSTAAATAAAGTATLLPTTVSFAAIGTGTAGVALLLAASIKSERDIQRRIKLLVSVHNTILANMKEYLGTDDGWDKTMKILTTQGKSVDDAETELRHILEKPELEERNGAVGNWETCSCFLFGTGCLTLMGASAGFASGNPIIGVMILDAGLAQFLVATENHRGLSQSEAEALVKHVEAVLIVAAQLNFDLSDLADDLRKAIPGYDGDAKSDFMDHMVDEYKMAPSDALVKPKGMPGCGVLRMIKC